MQTRAKEIRDYFFRGKPNEKFAICNAGGGFYYVGAMHDSFALIYRPDAKLACKDLARAIAFIHEHADKFQIDII